MPYYVTHKTAQVAVDGRHFSFGQEITGVEKLLAGEIENLVELGYVSETAPEGAATVEAQTLNPTALRPESGYAQPQTPGNAPQNDVFADSLANNHDNIEAEDEARQQASEPQNFTPTIDPATGQPVQAQQPQVDLATGQPIVAQPQVQQPVQQPNPDSGI